MSDFQNLATSSSAEGGILYPLAGCIAGWEMTIFDRGRIKELKDVREMTLRLDATSETFVPGHSWYESLLGRAVAKGLGLCAAWLEKLERKYEDLCLRKAP